MSNYGDTPGPYPSDGGHGQQRYPGYGQPPPYGQPPAYGYGAPAGYGNPMVPYGAAPDGLPWSPKSKTTAGLLNLLLAFVSIFGVGRLYAGHIGIGLSQLIGGIIAFMLLFAFIGFFILPIFFFWSLIDGIIMMSSSTLRDGDGLLMR